MEAIAKAQFNALLWTVWSQATGRLASQRPNGELVADQAERHWRLNRLSVVRPDDACPHWAAYRARAEPLVTEAASQQFPDQPPEVALRQLFFQMQQQPWQAIAALQRVCQHAELDQIIKADVWPWLEREAAAAQNFSQPDRSADAGTRAEQQPNGLAYREQIESLAMIAYRLHELGIQIAHLAEHEPSGGPNIGAAVTDEDPKSTLVFCSATLIEHAKYVRECAVTSRNTAMVSDQIGQHYGQTVDDSEQHQWWLDLTTRPITSEVRATVAAVATTEQRAVLLQRLAAESEGLLDELGEAFERTGWKRGTVAGAAVVGPKLRALSETLSAAG